MPQREGMKRSETKNRQRQNRNVVDQTILATRTANCTEQINKQSPKWISGLRPMPAKLCTINSSCSKARGICVSRSIDIKQLLKVFPAAIKNPALGGGSACCARGSISRQPADRPAFTKMCFVLLSPC